AGRALLGATMGATFVLAALLLAPGVLNGAGALLRPGLPDGGGLLALALVGTTVVPYNLFLGAGLARADGGSAAGESGALRAMRVGLFVAVPLGGLVTFAVLLLGAGLRDPQLADSAGTFSFGALAALLETRVGPWAGGLFACGLTAAGLSSAVTAPWAAALAVRDLRAPDDAAASRDRDAPWSDRGTMFRGVWLVVLLLGALFAMTGVRPVPAIILAQALNGIILPLVAFALWRAMRDPRRGAQRNGPLAHLALGVAVALSIVLGAIGLLRAFGVLG
ncbi:MAG: divalent metal cation transporter, partial [Acidobacteriota bacterium]